jgi:hypothetical protein
MTAMGGTVDLERSDLGGLRVALILPVAHLPEPVRAASEARP